MDVKTLGQAIGEVESAETALSSADSAQASAQAKYEQALISKQDADGKDADAVEVFNNALDGLIAAATAAKVVRSTPA